VPGFLLAAVVGTQATHNGKSRRQQEGRRLLGHRQRITVKAAGNKKGGVNDLGNCDSNLTVSFPGDGKGVREKACFGGIPTWVMGMKKRCILPCSNSVF
jgi:hypothetical protein